VSEAPTSIIEQAARRLAELKRAGIDAPSSDSTADSTSQARLQEMPAAPAVELAVGRMAAHDAASPFRRGPAAPAAAHPVDATVAASPKVEPEPSKAPVAPIGRTRSREVEIDIGRLEEAGYIVASNTSTLLAEEFRIIKRPLLMNMQDRGKEMTRSNLVMVTSSMAGEGKTFTALNLALSMALELDRRVLLVDADVAQSSVLRRLGLAPTKGLLDLLSDPEVAVSECLLRTSIDKFSVLSAGAPHVRSTELLASDAMSRLVAELATRYDDRVVIFDAPPLLASSEARALATHMGQIVFVVEADRTAQSTVSAALATIESCPIVMTVLNKARRNSSEAHYGYRH
jgi:protein-tyrosine kinase